MKNSKHRLFGGEHRVGEMKVAVSKQTPTQRNKKKRRIALSLIALGMVNTANAVVNCFGGCNYGTPSNPNWVYITWQCSDG